MVVIDFLWYEGLDYYEFEDFISLNYLMWMFIGLLIEVDVFYLVMFIFDLDCVLVVNLFLGFFLVINFEEEVLEVLVFFSSEEIYFVVIDGVYVYVVKCGEDQVEVIDLEIFEIVKIVSSGGDWLD